MYLVIYLLMQHKTMTVFTWVSFTQNYFVNQSPKMFLFFFFLELDRWSFERILNSKCTAEKSFFLNFVRVSCWLCVCVCMCAFSFVRNERMRSLYEWVNFLSYVCLYDECITYTYVYIRTNRYKCIITTQQQASERGTLTIFLCVGGKFIFLFACWTFYFWMWTYRVPIFVMWSVMKIYVTIVLCVEVGCTSSSVGLG